MRCITTLADWQQKVTGFGYDADSRRTSITRSNGAVTTRVIVAVRDRGRTFQSACTP